MKWNIKRMISTVLALMICLSLCPRIALPVQAETVGLTIEQLRQKFPHGKYWNHADNPGSSNEVNNQDGYSSVPCTRHGTIGTSRQTCNGFQPGDRQLSWQCMGYAEKLGYDATGLNPRDAGSGWYIDRSPSALDNLKPGDIVRYRYDGHSIYITGVDGDIVTYTDCNGDGHCIIQWDMTVTKAALRASFTYVHRAPSTAEPGPAVCDCSEEYAGEYICTTESTPLNIRGGHGSNYRVVGTIPRGATVVVTKASGTGNDDWAHVTYNGLTGFASMQFLSKKQENQERDSRMEIWMSDAAMGDTIQTIRTGERLYLCYKIYDANTGDPFDAYNTNGGYTAKLTLYETDGSVAQTGTYTNDNNCISMVGVTPGRYKGELVFTWDSGGTSTTTAYIEMVDAPDMQWVQATTTLGGNIGLNFYVKLSDALVEDETTAMRFVFDGKTIDVPLTAADMISGSDGVQYRFTCPLNAKNMTDPVFAQITTSKGTVGEGKTLTIVNYCEYMIRHGGDETLSALMKAMLNYGAAAQILFGHNTDALANAGLSEADRQLPEADASAYAHSTSGSEDGVQITNATLILETETTARIYFTVTGNRTVDLLTCTVDGVVVQPHASGSAYFLEIPDIAAQDLDVMHTVTIGGITVTYGGLSYVNQVLRYENAGESLVNTVKALFAYNKMAENFFN